LDAQGFVGDASQQALQLIKMTAADNFFWTFEQAASYYQFAVVNYLGFRDKRMLLAGGCGGSYDRTAG